MTTVPELIHEFTRLIYLIIKYKLFNLKNYINVLIY